MNVGEKNVKRINHYTLFICRHGHQEYAVGPATHTEWSTQNKTTVPFNDGKINF